MSPHYTHIHINIQTPHALGFWTPTGHTGPNVDTSTVCRAVFWKIREKTLPMFPLCAAYKNFAARRDAPELWSYVWAAG